MIKPNTSSKQDKVNRFMDAFICIALGVCAAILFIVPLHQWLNTL